MYDFKYLFGILLDNPFSPVPECVVKVVGSFLQLKIMNTVKPVREVNGLAAVLLWEQHKQQREQQQQQVEQQQQQTYVWVDLPLDRWRHAAAATASAVHKAVRKDSDGNPVRQIWV